MTQKILVKYLLIMTGTASLLLGIIGIFIPIMPTTPFLLLTSFCYLHSSKSLHNWLVNNRIFGRYIYSYVKYKAVKKSTKIGAVISMWSSLSISFYLVENLHVRILLFIVGILVSIHLLRLKTISKEQFEENEKNKIS